MSLKGGLVSVLDCFVLFSFAFRCYQSYVLVSVLGQSLFSYVVRLHLLLYSVCLCVSVRFCLLLKFFRFVSCFLLQGLFCFLLLLKLFVSLKNFIPSFLFQVQLCSHWIKLVAASPSLWTKDKLQSFRIILKDLWLPGFLENPPKWRMKKYLLMMGATAPASFCSRGAWLSRESDRDRYSSYL